MPCKGKGTCYVYWGKKSTEEKLSFSHATPLLDLVYIPTKNYQVISNSMGIMACTRFRHQGRYVHDGESESTLEIDAYWSLYMPLPNIIKLFQTTYTRIRPRNSFRGGN